MMFRCLFAHLFWSFCSSTGIIHNNQTSFTSSSLLTLTLSPQDHNQMLRCQVTNEASIHDTNVELPLDVLCK